MNFLNARQLKDQTGFIKKQVFIDFNKTKKLNFPSRLEIMN